MESGTYGPGNTKFEKLVVQKLPMNVFDSVVYSKAGCGATALSLLTGENPFSIRDRIKNTKGHYSDDFIRRSLRKNGISSYRLTKANLTNKDKYDLCYKIKDNNVLLVSQLLAKGEASWLVYWNNMCIHNYEIRNLSPFDLINFPILSGYVLYKKAWNK